MSNEALPEFAGPRQQRRAWEVNRLIDQTALARDNVARLKAQKLENEQRRREQELTGYKAGHLTVPLFESLLPE